MKNLASVFALLITLAPAAARADGDALAEAMRAQMTLLHVGNPWMEDVVVVDDYQVMADGVARIGGAGFRMTITIKYGENPLWKFSVASSGDTDVLIENFPELQNSKVDVSNFFMKSIHLSKIISTADPSITQPLLKLRLGETLAREDILTILRVVKAMVEAAAAEHKD